MKPLILIAERTTQATDYIRTIGGLRSKYVIITPENAKTDIYRIKGFEFKPDDIKILGDPALPFSVFSQIQAQIR